MLSENAQTQHQNISSHDPENSGFPLDLFSIRQTVLCSALPKRCSNNAPFFAFQVKDSTAYGLAQGCCNSWTCPRCGEMRARQEYGRMVAGCEQLTVNHDLYFITITTKGGGLSVREAKERYYEWTNRFLTAIRKNAKKRDLDWYYVQVTEWQKRGHPHSHLITTYYPDDLRPGTRRKFYTDAQGNRTWEYVDVLLSDYLPDRTQSAGLGKIYDISKVKSASAAARYVAKYLFKDTMFSHQYPKNWRRVRYSRSFPKLPELEGDAFVVMSKQDWQKLAEAAVTIQPRDFEALRALTARFEDVDAIYDLRYVQGEIDALTASESI